MFSLTLTAEDVSLMKNHGIEPFNAATPAYFKAGKIVHTNQGDIVEAYSRHAGKLLMSMGAFSYASANSWHVLNLKIGRYCSIAAHINILQGHHPIHTVTTSPYHYSPYYDHGSIPEEYVYGKKTKFKQVYGRSIVGNDVWIGKHATIKAGITIGDGAVIAGGANVTKDVLPYEMVGGNPAKHIRFRFPDELCKRLIASEWWNVSPAILKRLDMTDVEGFCTEIERLKSIGEAIPFNPPRFKITKAGLIPV